MESIVTLHSGSPVVSSQIVAEGAGIQHRAVLQLVKNYRPDIEAFGELAFEMRVQAAHSKGGRGPAHRAVLLNEQQATLILTYLRNSEQVRAFKQALVRAFFEMREALARQNAPKPLKLTRATRPALPNTPAESPCLPIGADGYRIELYRDYRGTMRTEVTPPNRFHPRPAPMSADAALRLVTLHPDCGGMSDAVLAFAIQEGLKRLGYEAEL